MHEEELMTEEESIEKATQEHPEYSDFLAKHGPGETLNGTSPRMHIYMHAMVERQLQGGEIHEMQTVLTKLTSQGMSRHEAIHRLAEPLTETIFEMMKSKKLFNKEAYVRKILKLMR